MQDRSKFDELLISFLSKELNEEDEAFVLQWIAFDEQNRLYFEELQKVWRLSSVKITVDQVDVNQEWVNFKQAVKKQQSSAAPVMESSGYNLADEPVPASKGKLFKLFVATAVAASVLLAIGLFTGIFNKTETGRKLAGGAIGKTETLSPLIRREVNYSGKQRRFMLNDGSEVILSDKSELSYREPFAANSRNLTLKGEAFFKVARDTSNPFTVFSGDLSTTALGTRFTVTAYERADHITVRLYEGKVVVKPGAALRQKLVTDFYLLPGQELVYHKRSSTTNLRHFLTPRIKANRLSDVNQDQDTEAADLPDLPLNEKGTWYMFNNEPLDRVFKQLEMIYNVKIVYSKREVARNYFIHKFEKSEPVEKILEKIAMVNDLKLTKKNDTFIIRK